MSSPIFEHLAVNVDDPVAMAEWYCSHFGMRVVRRGETSDHMHFLADASGRLVLEIYRALPDQIPDYRDMHPLLLHIAFATEDAEGDVERLVAAGCTALGDVRVNAAGDHMAMLRDPWGLAVQLCQRTEPMV